MLFSLIVYVHNSEKNLGKCLDSIDKQDFNDYEVIVVDDGSADGSGVICDEFAAKKNNVKVIHKDNIGRASSFNSGIEAATGDWLWFIDGSDYIVEGALGTIKERMRYAEGELYAFQHINVGENGENPEYVYCRDNQERINIKNDGDLRWNLSDRIFVYKDGCEISCRLFNRKIVTENSLRFRDSREVYSDELSFLAEYMLYVNKVFLFVNYLYVFRNRSEASEGAGSQSDVIPGLLNLLQALYTKAAKLGKKQVVKEFYIVCRGALTYQIQNNLGSLSDDEICNQIVARTKHSAIGKHVKKVQKELITAAHADRVRN